MASLYGGGPLADKGLHAGVATGLFGNAGHELLEAMVATVHRGPNSAANRVA